MAITDEDIGKRLWRDAKAQAIKMAELAGPAAGKKPLTRAEERLLFWREADGWTPDKEMALLLEGKTREEVGMLKYPHREKLAASGSRVLSKYQQFKYLADLARETDPTWSATPPDGVQPPTLAGPEPLPENLVVEPAAPTLPADDPLSSTYPPAEPLDPMLMGGV